MRDTFLPFSTPTIEDAEINEVVDSLRSGWITTGPKVKRFEEAFKAYVGAPFAVPLSSATAGLHLTLLALKIKEGDEIITTPMTFASTVSMIILCGGTPVLADIEPGTLNIDVNEVREKITPRTRAIIPVHFAGQSCDMDPLFALAREYGLTIIEDAAHAAGTEYKGQTDRLAGFDLDLLLPPQQEHHHRRGGHGLHRRREPGRRDLADEVPRHEPRGLETLCRQRHPQLRHPAARLQVQHDGYPGRHRHPPAAQAGRLHRPAQRYRRILQPGVRRRDRAGPAAAYAPYEQRHAWHLYTPLVRIEQLTIDRDRFMEELKKHNIGSGLHYKAIHHHAWYRENMPIADSELPNASYASERILSLPLFPKMTMDDARDVVAAVKEVISQHCL